MTALPVCYFPEEAAAACVGLSRLGAGYETLRKSSFAELRTRPAPSRSDELWRYTHFDRFDISSLSNPALLESRLTLIDGQSIPDFSGLKFKASPSVDSEFSEAVSSLAAEDPKREYWRALQFASATSGFVLEVSPGTERADWLLLKHSIDAEKAGVSSLGVVRVRKGASLKLFEDLDAEFAGLWLPRVEFVVEDGAQLDYVCLQRAGSRLNCLGRQRFHLGRDTRVKLTHLFCGGLLSRLDLDCLMRAPGAEVEMRALYLASGRQQIDFHPLQAHLAPHCKSHLYYKGVAMGQARSVYYGNILVAPEAQQTDAYQANRNLLLSPEARADSIPNLEIGANDVRCSHGSSVGQLGQDEMFYLLSRGLDPVRAKALLVEGFFEDLLKDIKDPVVHDRLWAVVLEKLNHAA